MSLCNLGCLLKLCIACDVCLLQVSAHVAQVVALRAYQGGYATALPKPHNLLDKARYEMYNPQYRTYR